MLMILRRRSCPEEERLRNIVSIFGRDRRIQVATAVTKAPASRHSTPLLYAAIPHRLVRRQWPPCHAALAGDCRPVKSAESPATEKFPGARPGMLTPDGHQFHPAPQVESARHLFRDEGRRYALRIINLKNAGRDELIRLIVSQHETIARQEVVIAAQQERIAVLEATVGQLTARVGELLTTLAIARDDVGGGTGRPQKMPGLKPAAACPRRSDGACLCGTVLPALSHPADPGGGLA